MTSTTAYAALRCDIANAMKAFAEFAQQTSEIRS